MDYNWRKYNNISIFLLVKEMVAASVDWSLSELGNSISIANTGGAGAGQGD